MGHKGLETKNILKTKLGEKRCLYPLCNKILYYTFRKDQQYCNTNCGGLDRKRIQLQKSKDITKIKQEAKQVYDHWIKSGISIYKLNYLDQLRVKMIILNKSHLPSIKEIREHERQRDQRYRLKHKQRINNNDRIRKKLFKNLVFAKFWNMQEKKVAISC